MFGVPKQFGSLSNLTSVIASLSKLEITVKHVNENITVTVIAGQHHLGEFTFNEIKSTEDGGVFLSLGGKTLLTPAGMNVHITTDSESFDKIAEAGGVETVYEEEPDSNGLAGE